jgi:hypothetical protein
MLLQDNKDPDRLWFGINDTYVLGVALQNVFDAWGVAASSADNPIPEIIKVLSF